MKRTVVEDLEVMVKTTCELGSHYQRLDVDREPEKLLQDIEAYQTKKGLFPSMKRRVILYAPSGLVKQLVTSQKELVSKIINVP